jgi:hypothetical protein
MTAPKLVGTIAEKDGSICVQTGSNVWYPLQGMSAIASKFRDAFGRAQPHDIGKRVYQIGNGIGSTILQMENDEQRAARLARENEA